MKRSRQREAILEILCATTSHPTADWIYDKVRERIPNISLGTVYRNLKLLAEEGEIRLRNISGSPERYDHICSNHYHLRCEQCGKVMDVEMPYMASLDEEVRKRNKYLIKSHDLTFVGLCPECAKKKH
mgnify:CR=1 FL=1